MRTFRFLGMAIIAILIGVNFIACSDDEEDDTTIKNEDGIVTNQKQLMQIKMVEDSDIITWDFTYDSKGRLIAINHAEKYDGGTDRDITNYTWSNNTIVAEDDDVTSTYSLNDNLVRTIRQTRDNSWERKRTFAYNSSNQVVNIQTTEGNHADTDSYTWDNDRIVKLASTEKGSYYNDEYVYEYTYGGKTCKGYFPLYSPYDSDDIFYVHPELIGLRNSQLPNKIYSKDKYSETTENFAYTFDNDGYVKSCTVVGIEKNLSGSTTYTVTTIFTFTWE